MMTIHLRVTTFGGVVGSRRAPRLVGQRGADDKRPWPLATVALAGSSNGRTAAFEAVNLGSIPSSAVGSEATRAQRRDGTTTRGLAPVIVLSRTPRITSATGECCGTRLPVPKPGRVSLP